MLMFVRLCAFVFVCAYLDRTMHFVECVCAFVCLCGCVVWQTLALCRVWNAFVINRVKDLVPIIPVRTKCLQNWFWTHPPQTNKKIVRRRCWRNLGFIIRPPSSASKQRLQTSLLRACGCGGSGSRRRSWAPLTFNISAAAASCPLSQQLQWILLLLQLHSLRGDDSGTYHLAHSTLAPST